MNLSALEISKKLKGSVFGDDKVIIQSLSRIEDAEKGSISFIAHEKYLPFLKKTKARIPWAIQRAVSIFYLFKYSVLQTSNIT